jgi:SUKH-4 immunity protein
MLCAMATDQQIDAALSAVAKKKVPFEGEWNSAPYPEHQMKGRTFAVLVDDPGVEALGVDRRTGEVVFWQDKGEEPVLVNRSLAQFAECAAVYVAAGKRAGAIDELDADALEANGEQALAAIRALDAEAVADEEQFWSVATEELGYGM